MNIIVPYLEKSRGNFISLHIIPVRIKVCLWRQSCQVADVIPRGIKICKDNPIVKVATYTFFYTQGLYGWIFLFGASGAGLNKLGGWGAQVEGGFIIEFVRSWKK